MPDLADDEHTPFNGGLRARLSQMEVALILVARIEYAKHLREAKVDEHGCVMVTVEELSLAFAQLLKRNLPESHAERRQLFRRLRQLRLISYPQEDGLDNPEAWVRIRPSITGILTEDALNALATDAECLALDRDPEEESPLETASASLDDSSTLFAPAPLH